MNIRTTFDRNWRFLVFIVLTALIIWALYTWRLVLLPFILGLVLAYLLAPIVGWIQRHLPGGKGKYASLMRTISVFLVFIFILGVMGFLIFIGISAAAHNLDQMIQNASQLITNLIARVQEWTETIRDKFPESMRADVDKTIQQIGNSISASLNSSITGAGSFVTRITSSLGYILGFAALPIFLFYLLKDYERISGEVYRELPNNVARHAQAVIQIIEKVLGRYIRAELVLGTIVGTMTLVGLLIIRAPFAVPLALFNGICEVIPTVGPIVGGAVMGLAMLAVAPDKVLWAVGLAIVVQLLENNLLVPRIEAGFLHLHPSVTILLLVLGGYFWGLWGLFLAVPIAATLIEIFKYVRKVNREANRKMDEKTAD